MSGQILMPHPDLPELGFRQEDRIAEVVTCGCSRHPD